MNKNLKNAFQKRWFVFLTFGLVVLLTACSGAVAASSETDVDSASVAAPTLAPTSEPAPTPTQKPVKPSHYEIILTAEGIDITEDIPPGLVKITTINKDTEWHSAIIRRLNDDVSLDEFSSAFQDDPRSTMPMTRFLGGPDISGGKKMPGYYNLSPGTYIVVDNVVEPWRFETFQVAGEPVQEDPPEIEIVTVEMSEYTFEMSNNVSSGKEIWRFTNKGEHLHNLGIIQLEEGKSIEDVAAWLNEQQGPPPFEYFGMWNLLSPGETSWGEIELPPGKYVAVDLVPDFASESGWNIEKGMWHEFESVNTDY
jgi:hypothetical protein